MPRDDRDYKVELSGVPAPGAPASGAPAGAQGGGPSGAGRPFLSIHFACCNAYQRIYRSADGTCYRGQCPRCGKPVRFPVGRGGTDARSFVVE